MKHWPITPLEEAYWFQEGPGVRKWQFRNSGTKLLNVSNITKEGVLDLTKTDRHLSNEEVTEKYSHFLLDAGDLVIASSGVSFDEDGLLRTRGAFVGPRDLPLCLNTSTIRFKPKNGFSSLAWLRYWLDSDEFRKQITRLVTGSAQQNFGPSHLKATQITLPPLAEQERIIKLLDRADELRKLRAQADERTAALAAALFHEMFGDSATNSKGWAHGTLQGFGAEVRYGLGQPPEADPAGVPILRATNIKRGLISEEGLLRVRRDAVPASRNAFLKADDVLVVRSGAYTGDVALVGKKWVGAVAGYDLVVSPGKRLIGEFVASLLLSKFVQEQYFNRLKLRAAQPHLNSAQVSATPFLCPPLSLQQEFACRVGEIRAIEAEQMVSRLQLDDMFQSILHKAFSGGL